ncbi:MAG: hypothetical protein AB8I80_19365, partial [Anaerolineae bacterium]
VQRVWQHLRNARYVITYPFGLYTRPLETPLSSLRPASATCEQCHWPAYFYPVRAYVDYDYGRDEQNLLTRTLVPLKIGNGERNPPGYGPGIHWHIERPIYYVAADAERQQIVWIQATVDGDTREYRLAGSDVTNQQISTGDRREMDCMDCHNRATHIIEKPAEAIDKAMATGRIAPDLPFIKQQGVLALEVTYQDQEEANKAISSIINFYRKSYPDLYAARARDVTDAVEQLLTIYEDTHFPHMNVYWDTYPNNVGHTDSAGCFRCHDGAHITDDGRVIPADCNLCHAIPQVSVGDELLPAVELDVKTLPDTHQTGLWLARHRYAFDNSCADCHNIVNPAGADDAGFCSNSVCHGVEWTYLDLDQATIQALVKPVWPPEPAQEAVPPQVPHPTDIGPICKRCHGLEQVLPYPANHAQLDVSECLTCHTPSTEARASGELVLGR